MQLKHWLISLFPKISYTWEKQIRHDMNEYKQIQYCYNTVPTDFITCHSALKNKENSEEVYWDCGVVYLLTCEALFR